MDSTITLTPFEEQVFQVFEMFISGVESHYIEYWGRKEYGYESWWGGREYERNRRPYDTDIRIYPKINFALGRLQKKGLVYREDDAEFQKHGYRTGQWSLTNEGKLLLGIA